MYAWLDEPGRSTWLSDDETFMNVNIKEQVVEGNAEGEKAAGRWAGI